jgi:hypothetical protein
MCWWSVWGRTYGSTPALSSPATHLGHSAASLSLQNCVKRRSLLRCSSNCQSALVAAFSRHRARCWDLAFKWSCATQNFGLDNVYGAEMQVSRLPRSLSGLRNDVAVQLCSCACPEWQEAHRTEEPVVLSLLAVGSPHSIHICVVLALHFGHCACMLSLQYSSFCGCGCGCRAASSLVGALCRGSGACIHVMLPPAFTFPGVHSLAMRCKGPGMHIHFFCMRCSTLLVPRIDGILRNCNMVRSENLLLKCQAQCFVVFKTFKLFFVMIGQPPSTGPSAKLCKSIRTVLTGSEV